MDFERLATAGAVMIMVCGCADDSIVQSPPRSQSRPSEMKGEPMLPPVNPFGSGFGDLNSTPLADFEAELRACLVRNHGFSSLPDEQVLEAYRNHLLGCLADDPRRYGLSLPRLSAYRGATVRLLQIEVLKKFPEWTIVLAQRCPEYQEVFITRDAIRTIDTSSVDDADAFMQKLGALERVARERVEGAVLRQLEYVRPNILSLLHRVTDENPCVIVAAFDNWRGDTNRLCIWSLSRTSDWNIAVPGSHGSSSAPVAVTDDGIAVSRDTDPITYRQLRSTANMWLVQSVVPASYQSDAFVCEGPIPNDGSKPREIPVTIERSKFLRDEDLPRVEMP